MNTGSQGQGLHQKACNRMNTAVGERVWVFIMKSDTERSRAANRGYDDSAGIYYSYDSKVGNIRQIRLEGNPFANEFNL